MRKDIGRKLTHPGESATFGLRVGAGWSFCFLHGMFFFFVLWGFLFNDGHIQNVSLFDIFIRECTMVQSMLVSMDYR